MRSYQRYPHGSSAILATPQQTTSPRIFPNARQIAKNSACHEAFLRARLLGYFLGAHASIPHPSPKNHAAYPLERRRKTRKYKTTPRSH